ncbi:hypothetical protein Shyhy01_29320 [Streptomyces hygroscopicus subsp. hygroscopicus]|nr:hypothetical protein Shyhy01_29320 [Streptomyces hygroscopicus subsp. hygroscopicus]
MRAATVARTDIPGTEITADPVRGLLRAQHPDLAERPLRLGARGWDNQLWRLGDDLAVRLPWATRTADALLPKEHTWLPALAPSLPLPVPVPQRLGASSEAFPRPRLATTWVPGTPADQAPRDARPGGGRGPHRLPDGPAPAGPGRRARRPGPRGRTGPPGRAVRGGADRGRRTGAAARSGNRTGRPPGPGGRRRRPPWPGPAVRLHGDLPADALTADGTFCGVTDFGDLCAGDPARGLAAGWTTLPDGALDRFHAAFRTAPDPATPRRARGWAVFRALGCLLIGEAGRHGRPGGRTGWGPPARAALRRIVSSARPGAPAAQRPALAPAPAGPTPRTGRPSTRAAGTRRARRAGSRRSGPGGR